MLPVLKRALEGFKELRMSIRFVGISNLRQSREAGEVLIFRMFWEHKGHEEPRRALRMGAVLCVASTIDLNKLLPLLSMKDSIKETALY